ncbi:hypothetical protein ACYFX5_03685 [Bremerella sp. T1]|uniref:hypothetical protein n=1 Tax=Bremerella sp. TYQ1 TaxID=3119568 RepID=UPI001CCA3519|nr:hypothetical protein [Bremerella volcania]UBM37373.1 hypothetical protein LA756_05640 [Bremerella volcania]
MPRVRRKAKRRRVSEATEADIEYLRSHFAFACSDLLVPFGQWDQVDDEAARKLWEEYRDVLTFEVAWKRPWAWWEWDAPERRRCISDVHPFDNPERTAYLESIGDLPWAEGGSGPLKNPNSLYMGKPAVIGGFRDKEGNFHAENYAYELEFCYLYRLRLFNDEEQQLWDEMVAEVKAGTDAGKEYQETLEQHGIKV